jgi:hypothetical protein
MSEQTHHGAHTRGLGPAIASAIPILGFGLSFTLIVTAQEIAHADLLRAAPLVILAASFAFTLGGFAAAWMRGFPRWSMPYAGLAICFTLYWSNVTTPGLKPFGYPLFGRELWGWRAWIPLLAVGGVCYLRAYHRVDWPAVQQRLRREWSLPLFAAYGPAVLMVAVILDEVTHPLALAASAMGVGILCAGAIAHNLMRTEKSRALTLLGAGILAELATGLFSAMYWDGRQESWMTAPARGLDTFARIATSSIIMLLVSGGFAWLMAQAFARLRLEGNSSSHGS